MDGPENIQTDEISLKLDDHADTETVQEEVKTVESITAGDKTDTNATDGAPVGSPPSTETTNDRRPTAVNSSAEMDPSTLHYEGETCIYTDPATKYQYAWDKSKNEWVSREAATNSYGYEGDTHTYTDPTDGTTYLWDAEKKAWFPKVDDDFLAQYQMNYGFTDPKVEAERAEKAAEAEREKAEKVKLELEAKLKRKAAPQDPTWFEQDEQHNTKVYVSNLPTDITQQEFVDLMQKCGMVMRDDVTNKMKIKLYTESGDSTRLKGDGLCSYIKIESVELALKLLDGYELRDKKICVERAKFQMRGSYDPNLKPKKRRRKDKDKLKKKQEALFDWRPEKMRGERSKHERTVIVKNLFDLQLFEKDPALILEYQQDMREECGKCGTVKKVVIYDRHADGVAQVTFSEPEEADACILLLNGRWFGQRKITAETWDGKTKYKVVETEEETKARLQKWGKFLETGEAAKVTGESATSIPVAPPVENVDEISAQSVETSDLVDVEPVIGIEVDAAEDADEIVAEKVTVDDEADVTDNEVSDDVDTDDD